MSDDERAGMYYGYSEVEILDNAAFYQRRVKRRLEEINNELRSHDYYVMIGDHYSAKVVWDALHSEDNLRHWKTLLTLADKFNWLKNELLKMKK